MTASSAEFLLIKKYFSMLTPPRDDVVIGIGDDCALLECAAGKQIAVSIDTLVAGVHFFADVDPVALGEKCLAVGLSDLAAMGAEPSWFTLALTLPAIDDSWLQKFSSGLAIMAAEYNVQLVGGDTTRGPLTISIQVHGAVAAKDAIRRNGAQTGDFIYVSGTLGDAGAALQMELQQLDITALDSKDQAFLRARLEQPTPRNKLGIQLAGVAHSAIDISDGLLADLEHILEQSNKGARLELTALPLSAALNKLDAQLAQQLALSSGDDYELCFTVAPADAATLDKQFDGLITRIGVVTAESGITIQSGGNDVGEKWQLIKAGYDHFSN